MFLPGLAQSFCLLFNFSFFSFSQRARSGQQGFLLSASVLVSKLPSDGTAINRSAGSSFHLRSFIRFTSLLAALMIVLIYSSSRPFLFSPKYYRFLYVSKQSLSIKFWFSRKVSKNEKILK